MVAYVEQRFPRRLPTFQLHLFMMKCSERILTCHLLDRMAFVLFGNADQPLLLCYLQEVCLVPPYVLPPI
jgi:hypothetical protein